LILSLVALLQKKYLRLFFINAVILLIHPITAVLLFIATTFCILVLDKQRFFLTLLKGIGIMLLISISFLPDFIRAVPASRLPLLMPESWLEIIKLRNTYAFPLLWTFKGWLSLILLLIPIAGYLGWKKHTGRNFNYADKVSLFLLVGAAFIFVGQILFTSLLPLTWMIPLQLGRVWQIPATLSLIYLAWILSKMVKRFSLTQTQLGLLLIGFLLIAYFVKDKVWYQHQSSEWIETQRWAQRHTSEDCTFLVDFYSQGFRVFSQRAIVGEYKDGTLAFYSSEFAQDWYQKYNLFGDTKTHRYMNNLDKIYANYPFSFVVSGISITANLPPIYKNKNYGIYEMPIKEKGCSLRV